MKNLSYKIYLNNIPVSKNITKLINLHLIKKLSCVSKGDDYQTIFTAPKSARSHIIKISKKVNQKITLIGYISNISSNKLVIGKKSINPIDFKGYSHKF